jgi:hypothetical protein
MSGVLVNENLKQKYFIGLPTVDTSAGQVESGC